MFYIAKNSIQTISVTLADKIFESLTGNYTLKLTNDTTLDEFNIVIEPDFTNIRYTTFRLQEGNGLTGTGQVDLKYDGSYTYEIIRDSVTLEKGKAIVHTGQVTPSNKFGTEVTYTEHTTTENNTQYITI